MFLLFMSCVVDVSLSSCFYTHVMCRILPNGAIDNEATRPQLMVAFPANPLGGILLHRLQYFVLHARIHGA